MPRCKTKYFGELDYDDQSIVQFPAGMPGFDNEKQFVLIDRADLKPLVFFQSLTTPELCFPTLPVLVVDPNYRLEMAEGDREVLGLMKRPAIGQDVGCFVILNLRESGTVVNLLAPLVIDLKTRRGMQTIVSECGYSHEHPFGSQTQAAGDSKEKTTLAR